MATYKSTQVTDQMPIPSHGLASYVNSQRFVVTLGAAITTADVLQFGYLPKFARVLDMILKATDVDTGATPAITLNVGDAGDPDRFFAASTAGQAGGVVRMSAATGFNVRFDDGVLITGAAAVNPAAGAAGSLELTVFYAVEDTGVGYPA